MKKLKICYVKNLISLIQKLIDFLIPPTCISCRSLVFHDSNLCPKCWSKLQFIKEPFCKKCGRILEYESEQCLRCIAFDKFFFDNTRSILMYNDISSKLILRFKHGDDLNIAIFFAKLIVNLSDGILSNIDLIIPVPIHWTRLIYRKSNQSAVLAFYVSKLSKIPFFTNILKRIKKTKPQQASIQFRKSNVKNAFSVNKKKSKLLINKNILLIDDVFTTGATLNECAKTLKKYGAKNINVVTIARV